MISIGYCDVNLLKEHSRNPRKLDDKQFLILQESIRNNPDYFEVRPILCTTDMTVFAGNMRLKAARAIGLAQVPVAIMNISDEKQRELLIRDNIQNGVFDHDILSSDYDLPELQDWGYDPVAFGFKSDFTAPAAAAPSTDDLTRWVYTCAECGTEHIFTKKDLKPYEE